MGAEPLLPELPGADRESVLLAAEAYGKESEIGDRVVVVAGGLVGCEVALHLAQQRKNVDIIEMLDEVALEANILHRRALLLELEKVVTIRSGLECTEITDEGVIAVDRNGERVTFACDTVVLAVGYRPPSELVDALLDTAPEVVPVGDCVKPRNLLWAVRTGYDAAMAV